MPNDASTTAFSLLQGENISLLRNLPTIVGRRAHSLEH
jgi:hypothetical protein